MRYEDSDDINRKSAKASVYIAEDGRARKRDVETGAADDSYIEIMSGIKTGVQVVTGPAKILRFLHDGDRISAEQPAAARE